MALSYVGGATGTNSATLPAFNVGDIAIVFAYRDGSNTPPTLATGWTTILGATGANTNSARSGSRVLQSGDTTTGTWTNATSVIVHVYRATDGTASIGASARGSGSSTTITYPAVTLQDTSGNSWGVRFAGHRSTNVAIETAPSGYTNRTSVSDATDEAAGFDTDGGITSQSSGTASVGGTASGFEAHTIELRFTPDPPVITSQPSNATVTEPATANFSITATGATSYQWQVNTGGGGTVSAGAAITGATDGSGSSISSLATPSYNQGAGDALIVRVKWEGTATQPTGVTDTAGNTFTARSVTVNGTSGVAIYDCLATSANASNVITVTWPSAIASYVLLAPIRFTITGSATYVDKPSTGLTGTGTSVVSGSFTAGDFAVSVIGTVGTGASGTPASGWTEDVEAGSAVGAQAMYRVDSPGGTYTAGNTLSTSSPWELAATSYTVGGAWTDVSTGSGGTTNSYTTGATDVSMSGYQYRCVATGAGGSTNSNAATLTVNPGGGAVTHATTGVLTGQGSTIAGSAAHVAVHGTSGSLTGPGSAITGSAARTRAHPSSGDLVGPGSNVAGSANRTRAHPTSGDLTGQGSTVSGAANRTREHPASGALTGPGSTVSGSAARTRVHPTSGDLVGPGSAVVGSADHASPAGSHDTTGSLVGQGSTVAGSAARVPNHQTSGSLVGQGSALSGSAARFRAFSTSGALVGPGSVVSGAAARANGPISHATTGALVGAGSLVSGSASRAGAAVTHDTSGNLVGPGSVITGTANEPSQLTPGFLWMLRRRKELEDALRSVPEPVAEVIKAEAPRSLEKPKAQARNELRKALELENLPYRAAYTQALERLVQQMRQQQDDDEEEEAVAEALLYIL